ncbi:polymorphic toxin type 15 domain-containing protein [Cellulomonas sp. NPDC089187]|uniref:polymorphic toxin type 15 domain-containing protein n=1 Tax=Cellulomonas sp. NPDC089187 TaxID=3154970 RepID=UPI00341D75AF
MTITDTMCVADGGLINPEAFPARAGDLDTSRITESATTMRGFGTAITEKTDTIHTSWSRLNGPYQAPEQDRVYTLMDPAVTSAGEVKSTFDQVAGHLDTYASTLEGLKSRLHSVEDEAATFRASVINGVTVDASDAKDASVGDHLAWAFDWVPGVDEEQVTVPWNEHGPSVDRNNALLEQYAGILSEITAAVATAANAINGLVEGMCMVPVEAIPAEAFTAPDAAMPWGSAATEDRNCRESVGKGAADFGTGLAEGAGMLLLGYNPENGDFFTGTGWGQAWGGLGDLVGSTLLLASPVGWVAAGMAATGNNDNDFSDFMYDRSMTVLSGFGSLVGYDPHNQDDPWHAWSEDGVAAGTNAVLSVGTFFIPGAGQVGAGLKTGSIGAKVARIAGAVSEFAVQGGSWAIKGGVKVVTGLSHAIRFGLDDMLRGLHPGQVATAGVNGVRVNPSGLLAMMDNGGHTRGHTPLPTGTQRVSDSIYGPDRTHTNPPDWAGDHRWGKPDVRQVPQQLWNDPRYDPAHPHYDATPRGEHGNIGTVNPDVDSPSGLTHSGRLVDGQIPEQLQPYVDSGKIVVDDGVLRLAEPARIEFTRNQPEHDFAEFERQVGLQQRALNQMSAHEWADRANSFTERVDNQASYRRREITLLAGRLREEFGLSASDARAQAKATLADQDPLHGPDQRAGGNPAQFTGMGDAGVNRSIGSQWSSSGLAVSMRRQLMLQLSRSGVPAELLGDIRITVKLTVKDMVGAR